MEMENQIKAQIRWLEKNIQEIKLKKKFWLFLIPTLILTSILILENNLEKEIFTFLSVAIAVMLSLVLLIVIDKYTQTEIKHKKIKKELIKKHFNKN